MSSPGDPKLHPHPNQPPPTEAPARTAGANEIGVSVAADAAGRVVTARRAGALRDMALCVDLRQVPKREALQNLAKAVNIAFQTDYGENFLEAVYQAAIVKRGEIRIVHKEYFGFKDHWFSQFGKLMRSMQLTLHGPDPASPEGQARFLEKGASSIRGLLNLVGRKMDLVPEYEDRVPALVEQMFDRLEGSGIITGWDRDQWSIDTTRIGLDIRIVSAPQAESEA